MERKIIKTKQNTKRPYGLCERDATGMCVGKCGRRGHLGRKLTIEEWLSFFGPKVNH